MVREILDTQHLQSSQCDYDGLLTHLTDEDSRSPSKSGSQRLQNTGLSDSKEALRSFSSKRKPSALMLNF